MAKSKAFIGIKRDALQIVAAIPAGYVTTFGSIGAYMSVVPRHIAYILATLRPEEQSSIPWYRVVGDGGKLGKAKYDVAGQSQAGLLIAEGLTIVDEAVEAFSTRYIDAAALASGVEPHKLYLAEA
jgi:methylated-DNA-protein-cysteine methyltransferase related protein